MARKLRMGMIGGGRSSSIGPIHHIGAELSDEIALVAGAFSQNAPDCLAAGLRYGLAPQRCYPSPQAMFAAERDRDDGIDFVTIATPNHLHLPAALEAIAAGVHIMSDKPATATLAQALTLRDALAGAQSLYALTFTYTGFAMVREARARVAAGQIGKVRKIVVNYAQGWMAKAVEKTGHRGAEWRMDPARGGVGGTSADIGVHAFTLAEFVSGSLVSEICADVNCLVEGRTLDDDCNVLMRFDNGAVGVMAITQAAHGERNALSFQVYGDTGAVSWNVERPDELKLVRHDNVELLTENSPALLVKEPLPRGAGPSILGAFAQIYRDFAKAVRGDPAIIGGSLAGIDAGVRSMRFVERAVDSSRARSGWVNLG